MNKINANLSAVIKRFPDREDSLKWLFLQSSDFQGICDDYHKCQEALLHLARSDKDKASALIKEYAHLLKELETEIIETLDEFNQGRAGGVSGKKTDSGMNEHRY